MTVNIPNDIKVKVTRDNDISVDITNGSLNINIVSGFQEYKGIFDIPEPGFLTLTTRNPNCDPRYNQELGLNTPIQVLCKTDYIFNGNIIDIDIKYGQKNEDTIITITAADALGMLSRYNFSEADSNYVRTNYPNGVTMEDFAQVMYELNYPNTVFTTPHSFFDYRYYIAGERTAIKAGDNAYEIFRKLAQSTLWDVSIEPSVNSIRLKPYVKYDPRFVEDYTYINPDITTYSDTQVSRYAYSSTQNTINAVGGTATPKGYKQIDLNDGLHRLYNQVSFSNDEIKYSGASSYTETTTTWGSYVNTESKTIFGGASLNLNTAMLASTSSPKVVLSEHFQQIAFDIFEAAAYTESDIRSITVDATLGDNDYNIGQFALYGNETTIYIDHTQTGFGNIKRFYNIIGINHNITRNTFETKFILRPHYMYILNDNRLPIPRFSNDGLYLWDFEKSTAEDYRVSLSNVPDIRNYKKIWFSAKSQQFGNQPIQDWYTHRANPGLLPSNTSRVTLWLAQTNGLALTQGGGVSDQYFRYAPNNGKKYLLPEGETDITWPAGASYQLDRGWDFPGDTQQVVVLQDENGWWKWAEPYAESGGSATTAGPTTLVTASVPTATYGTILHHQGLVEVDSTGSYFAGSPSTTSAYSWSITGPANSNNTTTFGNTSYIAYQYPNVGTSQISLTITNAGNVSNTYTSTVTINTVHKKVEGIRIRLEGIFKKVNGVWETWPLRQFGQFNAKTDTRAGMNSNYNQSIGFLTLDSFEGYKATNTLGFTSGVVDYVNEFASPYVTRPWNTTTYPDVISPIATSVTQIVAGQNDSKAYIRTFGTTSGTTSNMTEDIYVHLFIDVPQSTSGPVAQISNQQTRNLVKFNTTFRTQRTQGSSVTSSVAYATTSNPDIYYVPGIPAGEKIWVDVTDVPMSASTGTPGEPYFASITSWTTIGYFEPFLNGAWSGQTVTWSQEMIPIVTLPWQINL